MSKAALLDILPDEKRKVIFHRDTDGTARIETRQDVTHILEAARILADEPPGKDFRHVGFMPKTVMDSALSEGWFHDRAAIKRWLNDPANRDYRTWKGRV